MSIIEQEAPSTARGARKGSAMRISCQQDHLSRGLAGVSLTAGRRGRVSRQEFLVFNQELATLLKAGMPLVQSLDILRQRVANATFKAVADNLSSTAP